MKLLTERSFAVKLFISAVISLFFALFLLLVFSLIITFTGASNGVLKGVNTAIRLLSVGLCVLLAVEKQGGILKGALCGILTCTLVQLAFCAISCNFNVGEFLLNSLFCVIFGAIFGIIFVNLKNKGESS